MRLYPLRDQASVQHPDYDETFVVDADEGVELPDELAHELHRTHFGGKRVWETDAERHARQIAEEKARRSDPETLLAAVEEMNKNLAASKTPRKRAAAKAEGPPSDF